MGGWDVFGRRKATRRAEEDIAKFQQEQVAQRERLGTEFEAETRGGLERFLKAREPEEAQERRATIRKIRRMGRFGSPLGFKDIAMGEASIRGQREVAREQQAAAVRAKKSELEQSMQEAIQSFTQTRKAAAKGDISGTRNLVAQVATTIVLATLMPFIGPAPAVAAAAATAATAAKK